MDKYIVQNICSPAMLSWLFPRPFGHKQSSIHFAENLAAKMNQGQKKAASSMFLRTGINRQQMPTW